MVKREPIYWVLRRKHKMGPPDHVADWYYVGAEGEVRGRTLALRFASKEDASRNFKTWLGSHKPVPVYAKRAKAPGAIAWTDMVTLHKWTSDGESGEFTFDIEPADGGYYRVEIFRFVNGGPVRAARHTGFSSIADAKAHCEDWLRRHLENSE